MLMLMRGLRHPWLLIVVCLLSPASSARADYPAGHSCQLVAGFAQPRVLYRLADRADRLVLSVSPKNFAPVLPALRDTSTPQAVPAALPSEVQAPANSRGGSGGWWIVAGVGVIVIAGIVVAALVLGSSTSRTPDPVRGNVGGTVQTLGAP